jgi:hypothetical protein
MGQYLGDFAEDAIIRGDFNTRAKADGSPITLAGTPSLVVYKDGSVSESTAGVTLTVDFDSVTGSHLFSIDTSADAFYETGSDYRIKIAAGTVDGESVVGVTVGRFSIQNRFIRSEPPTAAANATATRTELATELGRIDTTISSRSTFAGGAVASVTGAVGSVTGNVGGNVVGTVASVVGAVGSVTAPVTVGANNDKTGYSLSQSFPANFASLGINVSGHLERVVLVDTTTTNSDMRGTDSAALASNYSATRAGYLDKLNVTGTLAHSDAANTYKADVSGLSTLTASQVWDHATRSLTTFGTLVSDIWSAGSRTLTAISDSTGVTTLLTRIVGTLASGTHNPQSGDSFARLGAPAGASIAADIAAIDGGGSTLTGPWTRTITVTDSVSGDPIQNATVRFFRTGETESKATNTSGVASFTVEAATWNYAIVANGYAGASGSVVVSADGDTAVTMVANSPAPPLNPNNATLRVTCIGEDSQIAPGAVVSIRMIEAPAGQVGFGYDGTIATFTANSSGIAEREVARGATYEIRREGTYKQWQKFVMPTDQDLILITSFVQP